MIPDPKIQLGHAAFVPHATGITPEPLRGAGNLPASSVLCAPFRFGDEVECRSFVDGEWLTGFRFLAYVPELGGAPYIVKGGPLHLVSPSYPIRAHSECRRAQS